MKKEKGGYTFKVEIVDDCDMGAPWENCDGHGPVRKTTARHSCGYSDKRPGERPLNRPGRNEYQFYYNWKEATRAATVDRWDTAPYDAEKRVERAVNADFDYLRKWVNGEWSYQVVTVEIEVNGKKYQTSLGGVDNSSDSYLFETVDELVDELLAEIETDIKQEKINNRFFDAMQCGL